MFSQRNKKNINISPLFGDMRVSLNRKVSKFIHVLMLWAEQDTVDPRYLDLAYLE